MKNIPAICIMTYLLLSELCSASSDLNIPVTANAIHFSSLTVSCNVVFNIDSNIKSSFSSITINYKNTIIEIPSNELNINKFSQLDRVELYQIGGSDTMYIVIIDYFGNKRERHEDRLFFDSKKYIKRLTAKVDVDDKVDYVTKIKGEAEKPGINDK